MRQRVGSVQAACILGLGMLSGCASLLPPSPLAPFFAPDSADTKLIQALAHEQNTRVERCHERKSCPQDHYTQALIALFQSRERALASFQQVRSVAPHTRLATSSTSWMDLLQANGASFKLLDAPSIGAVTEDFVWETLERELADGNESLRQLFSARAKRVGELAERPIRVRAGVPQDKDLGSVSREKDQATVQALQRQLQERERIIAERDHRLAVMSSQLDDLKRIELDSKERRRPIRPSATVTP